MGDDIPLWKILAVSLITALMSVIPLQKRGLKPGDILKYFKRTYFAPEIRLYSLYTALLERFPDSQFQLKLDEEAQKISIRRKANWRSFGEVIGISLKDSEVRVSVRPKYYLDLFDQGQALESLQTIEKTIKMKTQNAS